MSVTLIGIFASTFFESSTSHPALAVAVVRAAPAPAARPRATPDALRKLAGRPSNVETTLTTVAPSVTATTAPSECRTGAATSKRVVVSISSQMLWACVGPQLVNTSAVTTGADDSTPTGTFAVQAMEGPQYLNGCNASGCWHDYVHVWIPFDGPYGFHDAPWQTIAFGSPAYVTQGSHGCVHLPEAESAWLESWASVGMLVTIVR